MEPARRDLSAREPWRLKAAAERCRRRKVLSTARLGSLGLALLSISLLVGPSHARAGGAVDASTSMAKDVGRTPVHEGTGGSTKDSALETDEPNPGHPLSEDERVTDAAPSSADDVAQQSENSPSAGDTASADAASVDGQQSASGEDARKKHNSVSDRSLQQQQQQRNAWKPMPTASADGTTPKAGGNQPRPVAASAAATNPEAANDPSAPRKAADGIKTDSHRPHPAAKQQQGGGAHKPEATPVPKARSAQPMSPSEQRGGQKKVNEPGSKAETVPKHQARSKDFAEERRKERAEEIKQRAEAAKDRAKEREAVREHAQNAVRKAQEAAEAKRRASPAADARGQSQARREDAAHNAHSNDPVEKQQRKAAERIKNQVEELKNVRRAASGSASGDTQAGESGRATLEAMQERASDLAHRKMTALKQDNKVT